MLGETMQGKRKSLELSALPRLTVPTTGTTKSDRLSAAQPHALSVDFQCEKGEAVSPLSEVSPSSRCSVVSLSPSLFPLPPTGNAPPTPPRTSQSSIPDSPPGTSRSQKSISSWFSPPSPPPSTPLPPTPAQMRLASLIAATNGLESLQVPASAKVKTPLLEEIDLNDTYPSETPMTPPPKRRTNYNVDTKGIRESVVDPDAPLSPPPSSIPPPYSPGARTPERLSNISVPNTRVDSTTPLVYRDDDGTPRSPEAERERLNRHADVEEGQSKWWTRQHWQEKPKRKRRKRRSSHDHRGSRCRDLRSRVRFCGHIGRACATYLSCPPSYLSHDTRRRGFMIYATEMKEKGFGR
ncbi:hypothetical protein M426DRAFT_94618 [Hypoxylon sp. CI-4A]|nr:hypothetical protein M426DRAFT_94618 [Hypoxylon sp. CI-4A]